MIGFDCGTYNLVCARRDKDKNIVFKKEVNAFIEMPIENRFVFNMMKNAGVPLVERPEVGIAYALGEAAVNIAYTMNQVELKRPMTHGCLNPREKNAQQIMSLMMHALIGTASCDKESLYYTVPANAVNEETDADYHGKVLEAIFNAFEDGKKQKVAPTKINEGLALIYAELAAKAYTGIGVSCGAGMVNVCYAIFGAPVFEFSIVNSGDWIDKMTARATGESPAYINQEKTKLDLMKEQDSLILRAVKAQYEIMIQKTCTDIKKGLEKIGGKARANHAIDIVVAGGTSLPNGFDKLFGETITKIGLPIDIGQVIRPVEPLYSVAKGCLLAAEAAGQ